jgi:hypothetical protein
MWHHTKLSRVAQHLLHLIWHLVKYKARWQWEYTAREAVAIEPMIEMERTVMHYLFLIFPMDVYYRNMIVLKSEGFASYFII